MRILDKEGKVLKDKIDLGIVPVGESKEYEFFIENDTEYRVVEIKVEFDNSGNEIIILKQPYELSAKQKDILRIKWTAGVSVKKGLNSRKVRIIVSGTELWT